ncbi:Putative zinc- or iron-chelating domain containing protein [Acididesulfobacillus acetoxydans]|uniref:Zinc- or iron-chelating domain containing protein n=1 Tax=Acididesulfobacillus acetoxydans TaxID=1561005 RepID=A0A8S0W1P0_9FIRM|nr:YkgJ family cysteine cluster protein [Acididesulfobacillus acetoxydans]CAA7599648.1 Putative zinc- or iron-chelating domain containing protein [Acididesulfobacillus acetoxydans]CEJ06200.1 Putative zinc-or iron-chelating domain [Acididesulfobacillus acetoxydans]
MEEHDQILDEDSEFTFHCHDGLDCFGTCCRDINIFLTPYDVLRLKNFLRLSSGGFLARYTLRVPVHQSGFSFVQIKMSEEDSLKCPFITPKGCRVYPERPWACRIAPVKMLDGKKYSFCFESSFCHGLNEPKVQTVKEWLGDQGLEIYGAMEKRFGEIPLRVKLSGDRETDEKFAEFFFMACYDLDGFRDYLAHRPSLFENTAFRGNRPEPAELDDVQLMKFAFELLAEGPEGLKTLLPAE